MNVEMIEDAEVLTLEERPTKPQPVQIVPQRAATPAVLLQMAVDQGADLDRLERLMALQIQWEDRESAKAYSEAFAAFKAEAVKIIKNRKVTDGPLKNKSYAELHAVVNAATPALSKHGLSASWKLTKDERDWIEVTCTLKHVGGHSETVSMGGPPDAGGAKNAIQARASTVSYLERYTFKAITGLSEQDDDSDGSEPRQDNAPPELLAEARQAAMGGWSVLSQWIKHQPAANRELLEPHSESLKNAAKAADKAKATA